MSREFFSEIGDTLYVNTGNTVLTTKRKRLPYLVLYSQDVMGFYITLSKRILKQICGNLLYKWQRGKLTKRIYYVPKYEILTHLCNVTVWSSNKEIFWLFSQRIKAHLLLMYCIKNLSIGVSWGGFLSMSLVGHLLGQLVRCQKSCQISVVMGILIFESKFCRKV